MSTDSTTPDIKAIETRYAGCHFRSRLEARWAVFFDTLGIRWEYELEGLELSWRLQLDDTKLNYLPDFWLPDLRLWVEVKGSWTDAECDRFLNAAAHLSTNGGGGCAHRDYCNNPECDCGLRRTPQHCADVLLLPSIPDELAARIWKPILLHMHKGDLMASGWLPGAGPSCRAWLGNSERAVATDWGGDCYTDHGWPLSMLSKILLDGYASWFEGPWPINPSGVTDAYRAARSARFEHGQSGAT